MASTQGQQPNVELINQVKECLDKIGKCLDVASAVREAEKAVNEAKKAVNEAKEAVKELDGFLKLVKPPIWGLVWLLLAIIAYVVVLLFFIYPKLATQNLNAVSLWHNIALLFFPTVAFVSIVWAIVKICQPE
ncbi:MAG: hypothetical protein QXQ50_03795 [Candidatus Bathyarchaeia archaeon]